MDWVDKPQRICMILELFRSSHLCNFPLKTLKLGWVAFHPVTLQLKCLDFQSNQYKKLVPVLSRFCNWLWRQQKFDVSSVSHFCRMMRQDLSKVWQKNAATDSDIETCPRWSVWVPSESNIHYCSNWYTTWRSIFRLGQPTFFGYNGGNFHHVMIGTPLNAALE